MNSPCKGCVQPKRHPACHDTCPEYQAVKKADLELKQKIKAENRGQCQMAQMYTAKKSKRIKKFGNDLW